VRDIADVATGAVPRQGIVGQDGDDEIVSGIVLMRKGENPSEVLKAVKEQVAAINASGLPRPAQVVPFYDRTQLIDTTLTTVFRNLAEGALLVSVVLYLFLGNLRAAGIVAVVIPLSLLATFIGLRLRGIPANLLSLGAMDFGIIVDGAVIVLENVFRHLHEQREQQRAPRAIVLDAAAEVGRPTVFSILIIIIAHLPIFTLQRHEGRIFAPMAYTVVSALVGSLLFSLTLVPLLCLAFLGKSGVSEDNRLVRWCKRAYRPMVARALEHRTLVLAGAIAALAASLALTPRLGTEFLPELNEGSIWINIMLPPGISVSETSRQLARIRRVLRTFPEVRTVVSKSGRPEDGTDPKMINMAELLVDVKPPAEWRPHLSKDELIDRMNAALQAIPGIEPSFSQPIRDNVLESISQIDGQIVIKVFGEDM
jgi:heavy metal efflux system protein